MINLFCNRKNDVTKQLLLPMLEFIQKCMFSRVVYLGWCVCESCWVV
jgi:hypothetical protein